jgi:hypothetical protein
MGESASRGYCTKLVDSMEEVNNRKLCSGTKRYVGYYYGTIFPTYTEGTKYCFKVPSDFGKGGFSMLDGVIMKQETDSTWEEDMIDLLDFCATVSAGNHVLELWGATKCCDG